MHEGDRAPVKLRIIIDVEPDGDEFHAYCPTLKGLHTFGSTEEVAVNNAIDASLAYLESIIKHGEAFPRGILFDEEEVEEPVAPHKGHHHHTKTLDYIFNERWVYQNLHLSYWTEETFKKLADRIGLKVIASKVFKEHNLAGTGSMRFVLQRK